MNTQQFSDNWVVPNYGGRTIANIPATVAALLDVPFDGLPPLDKPLWQPFNGRLKRVVVILLDAFGWSLLQAERDVLQAELLDIAQIVEPITSIFPSTTAAALSSVWTGVGPAHHGLVGLTMFFPEYATGGQMLHLTPVFHNYRDALLHAGMEPESFLQWPGVGQQLTAGGVTTHSFKGAMIVDSALSRMHGRGVTKNYGIYTFSDLLNQMREVLEHSPDTPQYLHGYWPTIDSLSHYRLWDSATTRAEIRQLFHQIRSEFVDKLSPNARRETAVFITGDHGQIHFPAEKHIYIEDHPELQKMLLMRPLGEPRVVYLYAKQGRIDDVVNYLNTHLGHALLAIPAQQAMDGGLFGSPVNKMAYHPDALERLGDVVVIMRDEYCLLSEPLRPLFSRMIGGHGGMTTGEMQVPWIGIHLDE